jgi:hypothetical protein
LSLDKSDQNHGGNPRRRIKVTSFLNEISTDQLRKRVGVRGWGALLLPPPSLSTPETKFANRFLGCLKVYKVGLRLLNRRRERGFLRLVYLLHGLVRNP